MWVWGRRGVFKGQTRKDGGLIMVKNGREVSGKLGRRYSAFSLKQLAKLGLYGSRGYIEVTKAEPRGEVDESETALILQQQKTFAE